MLIELQCYFYDKYRFINMIFYMKCDLGILIKIVI